MNTDDLLILTLNLQISSSEIDMPGSKSLKKNPNVELPILELEKKNEVIPSRNKKVGRVERA